MSQRIAFIGRKALGSVRMRGVDVAAKLGVPFLPLKAITSGKRWDTLVLVKYWTDRRENYAKWIRRRCDRLIFDPSDCFSQYKPHAEPGDFWRWCHKQLDFDEIVATSPAALESMGVLLREKVLGHLMPHHADPRVGPDWYDPDGPVVYAGGPQFIRSAVDEIAVACNRLSRRFVLAEGPGSWRALKGAALCLHLRLPPTDTPLARVAKPQVKLENAAAAGLPCLATPHACATSLERPRGQALPQRRGVYWTADNEQQWLGTLDWAQDAPPLSNPVTLDQHCARWREVLRL